jgi:hypothetical protein
MRMVSAEDSSQSGRCRVAIDAARRPRRKKRPVIFQPSISRASADPPSATVNPTILEARQRKLVTGKLLSLKMLFDCSPSLPYRFSKLFLRRYEASGRPR